MKAEHAIGIDFVDCGGGLSVYGPTINIVRDPRWGRNQETVSEDPWFSGRYADAFIRGVQGPQTASKYLAVAATCKHLAAYGVETDRHDFDAVVSAADMQDSYKPPFEACVREGGASCVMCRCSSRYSRDIAEI